MFGVVTRLVFFRGLMMNYVRLSHSPRLQRVHELLNQGGEHSTLEISIRAGVIAISSIISELRAQGADIRCRQIRSKQTGERIWVYRMVSPVPAIRR